MTGIVEGIPWSAHAVHSSSLSLLFMLHVPWSLMLPCRPPRKGHAWGCLAAGLSAEGNMAAGTIQVGGGCDSQKGPASGELTRVTAAPLPPGLENHATFSASHDYPLRAPSKRSNSNRKKLPGSFLPFSASTRLEIPPLQFPPTFCSLRDSSASLSCIPVPRPCRSKGGGWGQLDNPVRWRTRVLSAI